MERRPGIADVKNEVTSRVRSGLSVTELQRTPTEGSYQQSLFGEFFFIYNVCLTGRAGRPGKKIWEILGYGFQDMVFTTWDLNFGAWEILGYDFQDMVSKTET